MRPRGAKLTCKFAGVALIAMSAASGQCGEPAPTRGVQELVRLVLDSSPTDKTLAVLRENAPRSYRALENAALDASTPDQVLNALEYAIALRVFTPRIIRGVGRILDADACVEVVVDSLAHVGPNTFHASVRRRSVHFGVARIERQFLVTLLADPRVTLESLQTMLLGQRVMLALHTGPQGWLVTRQGYWLPTDREARLLKVARPLTLRDPASLLAAMASEDLREAWLATVRVMWNSRSLGSRLAPWVTSDWTWRGLLAVRSSVRETLESLAARLDWDSAEGRWAIRSEHSE